MRLLFVVPLLVCSSALAACGTAKESSEAQDLEATPTTTEYFASEYGVTLGVRVGFSEDRRVTGARLLWDGGSDEVGLYPLDGTDPDVSPETLDLPRGVQVLLEGSVLSACPEAPSLPVFEVETVHEGENITERYVPNEPAKFEDAFEQWCALPFIVTLGRSSSAPDGECSYMLRLHNPGPATVDVVSESVSGGDWSWEHSKTAVPAGTLGSLTIHGKGAPPNAPWESGHLLADGHPIAPGGGVATATATDALC